MKSLQNTSDELVKSAMKTGQNIKMNNPVVKDIGSFDFSKFFRVMTDEIKKDMKWK